MHLQSNKSLHWLTSKRQQAAVWGTELLLPSTKVAELCAELGIEFRDRVYTPLVTVWLFLLQTLSADHSCQQAVARLNAWRTARGLPRCSSETTAYCKARVRLPEPLFARLLAWTADRCDQAADRGWLFQGREVELVDGLTVTMADTGENQKQYPQLAKQRPGCGFPLARLVTILSLATGAVSSLAIGPYAGKRTGETSLLRTLLHRIEPGKILLADRYYATFWLLALGEMQQIDLVTRTHQLRRIDFRKGLKQGSYDQLVAYPRPARPAWMTRAEYLRHPAFILVRHVRFRVEQLGFRTREVTLATTLLDAQVYSAANLAQLYRQRWLVELHIRSLKTQMQMEHLRCKTPAMIRKELYAHLIGYNIVRAAMQAAALKFGICPTQLSFTGTMQALEELATGLRLQAGRVPQQWENLLATINELRVGDRPGRSEPRRVKRRPKSYPLLRQPRHKYTSHYSGVA